MSAFLDPLGALGDSGRLEALLETACAGARLKGRSGSFKKDAFRNFSSDNWAH